MVFNIYDHVATLSSALRNSGEEQWSKALDDALSISTVPGEILGETRLQLRELKKTGIPKRLSLQERVDEALKYLDNVLNP